MRKARKAARLVAAATVALAGSALTLLSQAPAANAATTGEVYVVQALQGETVDVLVDDAVHARAAAAKTIVGPLNLPAGTHVLVLRSGGKDEVTAKFTVQSGTSTDVVAHRTADAAMAAVVTVFPNDLTPVAPGKLRLVVSHVAVAPPADIRVDGSPLFRNVANGESTSLVVPAMTATVDVVPTATSGPAILAPVSLTLTAGTLTRVFAIGDATAKTTDAVVQTFPVKIVGSKAPGLIRTGDGGQTADSVLGGPAWGTMLTVVIAVLLVAVAGVVRGAAGADRVIGSRHSR